jgi:alpha-N-arabinofuranosidase
VTGDVSTKWGARRAKDGHPAPFRLQFVEIGNEDGFDRAKTYDGRYTQFHDAIKAKYPQLKLISTVNGKDPLGQRQLLTSRTPDLVDEHYYCSALQMMDNAGRYDTYERSGPKIFVGEWATREGSPTTNLIAGLADGAWLTALERNADIIAMSCYAPLFCNVNPGGMQWHSDLIGYDALNSYGSPSYYVQKMFSENLGDVALVTQSDGIPTQTWQPATPKPKKDQPAPAQPPTKQVPTLFFSATKTTKNGTIYLKVVNTIATPQVVKIELIGAKKITPIGQAITLSSAKPDDTNSITEPIKIVPVKTDVDGLGAQFSRTFPAYSVTILVITTQ